eukprot:TRINITY_DN30557_c0_g1_i1.p1 TRINITY_DN30557_c0_g1~~TRINITY_DN30557_c0_g1_i1.p1  ORF type:complete len:604 (+),score=169.08 TRINITY_DN30557_c0_g1_i1:145-1956(+)
MTDPRSVAGAGRGSEAQSAPPSPSSSAGPELAGAGVQPPVAGRGRAVPAAGGPPYVAVGMGHRNSTASIGTPPSTPQSTTARLKAGPRSFKAHQPVSLLGPRPPASAQSEEPDELAIQCGTTPFIVTRGGVQSMTEFLQVNRSAAAASAANSPMVYSAGASVHYDDLVEKELLGGGHSSRVVRCIHSPTQRVFAMKQIRISGARKTRGGGRVSVAEQSSGLKSAAKRELQVLHQNFKCNYILKYYNAFFVDSQLKIVLEYMYYGSLSRVVENLADVRSRRGSGTDARVLVSPRSQHVDAAPARDEDAVTPLTRGVSFETLQGARLPEGFLAVVMEHVACGLKYMHETCKRVHRDIKPSNLLVSSKGVVKISDFGISEDTNADDIDIGEGLSVAGTFLFMSPERLEGKSKCSPSGDVWALGVTLANCGLGEYPYDLRGLRDEFELRQLVCSPVHLSEEVVGSPALRSLIAACTSPEPTGRPTASEILQVPVVAQAEQSFNVLQYLSEELGPPPPEGQAAQEGAQEVATPQEGVATPQEDSPPAMPLGRGTGGPQQIAESPGISHGASSSAGSSGSRNRPSSGRQPGNPSLPPAGSPMPAPGAAQ